MPGAGVPVNPAPDRRVPFAGAVALVFAMSACVSVSTSGDAARTPDLPASSAAPARITTAPSAAPTPDARPSASIGTPPLSDELSVGYIALDESLRYGAAVSEGIVQEAAAAGIGLVACDSGWSREGALDCARQLHEAGVHGLVSFQPFEDAGAELCETVGDVPTVGIVFDQGPCQVSLLEVDQAASGRLAGEALGRFADERWDCEVSAYVSLESSDADPDGRERMQGYRDGFEQHCALPEQVIVLDGADRLATAEQQLGAILDEIDGERVIVAGLNEDAVLGAMEAARAAGRARHLWYSGQLADPSIRVHIACDKHYVASVAQFPGEFGAQVVPALLDAIAGDAVEPTLEARLELVDASNVRAFYPDTPPCDEGPAQSGLLG